MTELEPGARVTFDLGDGRRREGTVLHLLGSDVAIREQQAPGGTVVMPQDSVESVEDSSE